MELLWVSPISKSVSCRTFRGSYLRLQRRFLMDVYTKYSPSGSHFHILFLCCLFHLSLSKCVSLFFKTWSLMCLASTCKHRFMAKAHGDGWPYLNQLTPVIFEFAVELMKILVQFFGEASDNQGVKTVHHRMPMAKYKSLFPDCSI